MKYIRTSIILFSILLSIPVVTQAQSYNDLYSSAIAYADSGLYDKAESVYISALRAEPAGVLNGLILTNLGNVQRHLGKNKEALVSFTTALQINANNVKALQNRALLLIEENQLDKALDDYNEALRIEPNNPLLIYQRAFLYFLKQDFEHSFSETEALLKQNPNSLEGIWLQAVLYLYKDQPQRTIDLLSPLIKGESVIKIKALTTLTEAYYKTKNWNKALETINNAIEIEPEYPGHYYQRAAVYERLLEKEGAKKDMEKYNSLRKKNLTVDKKKGD